MFECRERERERERETETETEIPGLFHECILIMLFALFTVLLVHIYINYSVEKKMTNKRPYEFSISSLFIIIIINLICNMYNMYRQNRAA